MGLVREYDWTTCSRIDFNSKYLDNKCPLQVAIRHGTLASILKDKSIVPKTFFTEKHPISIVLHAVAFNNIPALRLLLEDGRFDPNEYDSHGEFCPLTHAAMHSMEMVRILAGDPRVNIHALNTHGQNIITIAALNGQTDTVKFLLDEDKRVDPWELDNKGFTALHGAVLQGHTTTAKLLLLPRGTRFTPKEGKERTYHRRNIGAHMRIDSPPLY